MKNCLLLLVCISSFIFAGTVQVTFRVNMKMQMRRGNFLSSDSAVVRGDFQIDAGDVNGNWQGNRFLLSDPDNDSIFSVTTHFSDTCIGKTYNYKFVMHEVWEPTPNHLFTLTNALHQELTAYYFANDSIFMQAVINTINFTADLGDMLGTSTGHFNSNQDSINIAGLDWDGLGTYVSGNRRLTEVVYPPKRFKTTLTIKGPAGDSTKWKFRLMPESLFTNGGWELGEDHWFKFRNNGDTITLPEMIPNYGSPFIGFNGTALFTCNMNNAPRNKYNGELIPVNQIGFVGLKGGTAKLGNWGGNWTTNDTVGSSPSLIKLNDNGINGDLLANDNIWSCLVEFPELIPGGKIEFKYACMYPGADTVNNGVAPLDNEGAFGQNHWINLRGAPASIVTNQIWGLMVGVISGDNSTTVADFSLGQNYPNPFNPATNFTYTIPVDGNVSLKVYNTMGEEVAAVFDGFQHAGKWNATINGYGLSSGVYFYTLRAGNYSGSRKMLLVK
ncbi:MAG: T9SS type A sorting domain-containing protein [Ignavibacteriales bacterium]|nr:T9SS type A sorting domain-containing protein [Ignavibacteriales bacterium]